MAKNKEIIHVNELSKSGKASMKTRVISSLVALAIALPALILGDWFTIVLMAFLACAASYEIVRCAKPKHSIWLTILAMIFTLTLSFWPMLREGFKSISIENGFKPWMSFIGIYISVIVLVVALFLFFFFVVIDSNTTVSDASFIFTACFLVALGIQSATYIRFFPIVDRYNYLETNVAPSVSYFNLFENFQSFAFFFYVVGGSLFTDIGAYFVGVFFGKHKMNERISPKKTWEGFFGGIIFSTACSFAFAMILAANNFPLLTTLTVNHWYDILGLSILIPIASTLGDFVFSSFKRFYGIKDFGNIMPGHGGILDRVDSVIFASLIVAVVIYMFSNNYFILV